MVLYIAPEIRKTCKSALCSVLIKHFFNSHQAQWVKLLCFTFLCWVVFACKHEPLLIANIRLTASLTENGVWGILSSTPYALFILNHLIEVLYCIIVNDLWLFCWELCCPDCSFAVPVSGFCDDGNYIIYLFSMLGNFVKMFDCQHNKHEHDVTVSPPIFSKPYKGINRALCLRFV